MRTKERLLDRLKENRGQWVSGEQISSQLGISRTAVWKHINHLKAEGHQIESGPKKGYRLIKAADLLVIEKIQTHLTTQVMGRAAIHLFQETDSTNIQAKNLAAQGAVEGTVVLADSQTHGRGRRGRHWFSPPGRSIHASLILKPQMAPHKAPQITLMAAVAVANTLQHVTGLDAKIKWPNDILIQGKKVAGILTEISTEMDMVDFVVVGLGLNVNTRKGEMPREIEQISTSIHIETGTETARNHLVGQMLNQFEKHYEQLKTDGFAPIMNQWRAKSGIIGQRVYVDVLETRHIGTVETVDDDGVLILKDDQGGIQRIFSGDVTKVRPR